MKKKNEIPPHTDYGLVFQQFDESKSRELLRMLNKGDARAFHILIVENTTNLREFVSRWLPIREDAEEAVQELLVCLWENKDKIKYEHVDQLYKYILKAAKNQALQLLRSMRRKNGYCAEYVSCVDEMTEALDEIIRFAKMEDVYSKAIQEMPQARFNAFDMKYNKDYSYEKIAEKLNITEATARSHVRNAVNDIKRAFGLLSKNKNTVLTGADGHVVKE